MANPSMSPEHKRKKGYLMNYKDWSRHLFIIFLIGCSKGTIPGNDSLEAKETTVHDTTSAPGDTNNGDGGTIDEGGTSEEPVDNTDSITWNLGSIEVDGFTYIQLSFSEDGEGCDGLNSVGVISNTYEDNNRTDNSLYIAVLFDEGFEATYNIATGERSEGDTGSDSDESLSQINIHAYINGVHHGASSGELTLSVDSNSEGSVSLTDTIIGNEDIGTYILNGSLTLPLYVTCSYLDSDGGCGWITDFAPYSTDFCRSATAGFADHVLY